MVNYVNLNEKENTLEIDVINDVFDTNNINEEFSVIFVSKDYIKELNTTYRDKDYVTDVLTFISDEEDYLGDVFISLDKAIEQSTELGHSYEREVAFLATHGYLHLQGYDHLNDEEEKVMFEKQDEILNKTDYRR